MASDGVSTKSFANFCSCRWFVKITYKLGYDFTIRLSKGGGLKNKQLGVVNIKYLSMLTKREN
jgi:hypothetical protein